MRLVLFLFLTAAARAVDGPAVPDLPRLPALSPAQALAAFQMSPGFTISAAAVEPQVVDPVALSFDDRGALYVAEMRDYSERRDEKLSRIRKLVDRDGDGVFESATVFMEGLAWATSVCWHQGVVYVAASPDLWRLRDADGDGIAEVQEKIFTGFGEGTARLNVQALVNSLTPGPDGRIYGAAAANGGVVRRPDAPAGSGVSVRGRDFSFDPATLDFREEPGGGQFGLTFDAWGRRFVCSNSHHIQWIAPVRRGGYLPTPAELVDIAEDGPAAPVFRLSPDEPWRVLRTNWRASGLVPGLVEGEGKASGYFTSASGIHLWRQDAIIADCGSNLVHRKTFRETVDGPVAVRPAEEKDREFLASTDTWFRPVAFTTAPDGSLLIADFYREYIEHPDSLPANLKARMDLNSGNDRGRIWRVKARQQEVAARTVPHPLLSEITGTPEVDRPALWARWWKEAGSASGRAAATLLASLKNEAEAQEFHRRCLPGLTLAESLDLAARLKIPPPDALNEPLESLLQQTGSASPQRMDALKILSRAGAGPVGALAGQAREPEAVRVLALRLVPQAATGLLEQWPELSGILRSEVVAALAGRPDGPGLLLEKIRQGVLRPGDIPPALAAAWRAGGTAATKALATELLPAPLRDRTAVIAQRQAVLTLPGGAERGALVFQQRCAMCHQDGGPGPAPGPDRASFRNKGKPLLLLAILDPDREVAPQYARTTLTLKNGTVSAGVTTMESPEEVRLILPAGQELVVPRRDIARVERDAASLMPTGVEEGLSDQELADLLAWLVR